MHSFVKERIKSLISAATFCAITADKTSCADNTSLIAIHCYIMKDWQCLPFLINLQKLESDGATSNSLKVV